MKSLSRVQLFVTPWTVAYQAPPSMGFSRQEYWSGLPFPSPGDLPNPGIEPGFPALEADALTSESPGKPPREAPSIVSAKYTVLIYCTCHFQSGSLFILAASVCRSLQCLISSLTQGPEVVTCSVVLWGRRKTANKYDWRVWGALAVPGSHWGRPRSGRVCFPRLHCSGSRLLCRGTV